MPPLFVVGPQGDTSELVNYRVRGNNIMVDRLFTAAELRVGADKDKKSVRISRTDGRPSYEWYRTREEERAGTHPLTGEAEVAMRLRPEPPRVTRLSRKVLAGLSRLPGSGSAER